MNVWQKMGVPPERIYISLSDAGRGACNAIWGVKLVTHRPKCPPWLACLWGCVYRHKARP